MSPTDVYMTYYAQIRTGYCIVFSFVNNTKMADVFFIFKARLEKYIRNEFHHLILAKFRSAVENERSLFLEILASNSFS